MNDIDIESLKGIANQLRIHSIAATTAAGSGHPTSCCSAADLVAALLFGHMRYDPKNPHYHNNDRFILAKGHAAPLLYAAWAETGLFPTEKLLTLRQLNSDLEGHPTPRLSFADVATGSLGQGLSIGVGMALCARLDKLDYRTYVLLGDGECAEGAVWEAASLAGVNQLNNLIAIVDVNRLGQSQATPFGHQLDVYKKRFEAFGNALLRIGEVDPRIVALDGDTMNSTYSEKFYKKFPARFMECFIAEQNMVGVAAGFGARGKVPFASTFATFFCRACDQIRVAGISMANIKLAGSHVGVSIGEDGPSQMGLEDIAIMRAIAGSVVLYPSDAVSAEKLMEQMALHKGIGFLRTSRPKAPVLY